MKLKLKDWALLAEIVAAAAVVISIAHLALEVQRNTSAIQSQISQGLLEMSNQANQLISLDGEFADLFVRAKADPGSLSEADALRWRRWINSELNIWEHAYYSYANGTMDERLWKGYDVSFRGLYCQDSSQRIWREIETFYGDDFRKHVNSTSDEDCRQTSF